LEHLTATEWFDRDMQIIEFGRILTARRICGLARENDKEEYSGPYLEMTHGDKCTLRNLSRFAIIRDPVAVPILELLNLD